MGTRHAVGEGLRALRDGLQSAGGIVAVIHRRAIGGDHRLSLIRLVVIVLHHAEIRRFRSNAARFVIGPGDRPRGVADARPATGIVVGIGHHGIGVRHLLRTIQHIAGHIDPAAQSVEERPPRSLHRRPLDVAIHHGLRLPAENHEHRIRRIALPIVLRLPDDLQRLRRPGDRDRRRRLADANRVRPKETTSSNALAHHFFFGSIKQRSSSLQMRDWTFRLYQLVSSTFLSASRNAPDSKSYDGSSFAYTEK